MFWDIDQTEYNNNAAVLMISGNKSDMGTIINANHELEQSLGYKKDELIGENISIIMPETIGKHHNIFLQSSFEKKDQSNKEEIKERLVFSQHKKGYLVPTLLFARVVPNLENGVQFLGFLKPASKLEEWQSSDSQITNDDVFILLLNSNYEIMGFNQTIAKLCNRDENSIDIHKYIDGDKKLKLLALYPEFGSEANHEWLRSPAGGFLSIDLMTLKQVVSTEIVDSYTDKESEY